MLVLKLFKYARWSKHVTGSISDRWIEVTISETKIIINWYKTVKSVVAILLLNKIPIKIIIPIKPI